MTLQPEALALTQIHTLCQGHAQALTDALDDIGQLTITADIYANLSKNDRRLLDQFAYRYTRLQDDMGAKLMPAVLRFLGEDIARMSAIDRFARLEQLGWLPDAQAWNELRHIRNEFTHDYPETAELRFEKFTAAKDASTRLLALMHRFTGYISERRLISN
ncbi:hypothetical protein C5F52_17560 [Limnohabitans sp. TS-CS-82]|uniref:hypothetical protein n=1 Tax=Limnohabitans sp. TS-CS-82 TaxID=2094193 RepID=UPI000CF2E3AE|nr:hypothetical protein [Limnohabitans sp. TS-CS-82]PQA81826.1 hypothetical protein C5F52_17560 [Limnohabitans sp. TS-CS-82]